MVRSWFAITVIAMIISSTFIALLPSDVEAQTVKGWDWGSEVKYFEMAWTGSHNNTTIDDFAVLILYSLRYDGQPAIGVTVIANITDHNGKRYWFKDGTSTLYDQIRYDGRDDTGKKLGDPIGEAINDGVYANLVALGHPGNVPTKRFGPKPGWYVNVTCYLPGRPLMMTQNFIEADDPQSDTVHWLDSIDLNTNTTGQDWNIQAKPSQNLTGSIILNQTGQCIPTVGCSFRMSAWMTPFEKSGQEFRIYEGNASHAGKEAIKWNYTAPSKPGRYTLTVSETFQGWWPLYNQSVLFVGRILVADTVVTPKVELISPQNGSEVTTYKPTLSWAGTGFELNKPIFLVQMDDLNGSSFNVARTNAVSAAVEVTGKRHQMWSVVAYDGFERTYSKVWSFNVKGDAGTDRHPSVSLASPPEGFISNSSELSFSWTGLDLDGDQLTYIFQVMYRSNKTIITTKEIKENNTKAWLPNGEYSWTVVPKDPWNTGTCTNCDRTLDVHVMVNTQPYATLISPPNGKLVGNESIDFRWDGFDPQDDKLQYKLEVRNAMNGELYVERYIYDKNVTLWLPPWRYTWTVIPYDGNLWGWNINGTWSFEVTGKVNRPPVITSNPPRTLYVGKEYDYQVLATDPDKDQLTYSLIDAPNNMSVDRRNGLIYWIPGPDDVGTKEITIVALDGRGGRTTQTFQLYISQDQGPVRTSVEDRAPFFIVLILVIAVSIISAGAMVGLQRRNRAR